MFYEQYSGEASRILEQDSEEVAVTFPNYSLLNNPSLGHSSKLLAMLMSPICLECSVWVHAQFAKIMDANLFGWLLSCFVLN